MTDAVADVDIFYVVPDSTDALKNAYRDTALALMKNDVTRHCNVGFLSRVSRSALKDYSQMMLRVPLSQSVKFVAFAEPFLRKFTDDYADMKDVDFIKTNLPEPTDRKSAEWLWVFSGHEMLYVENGFVRSICGKEDNAIILTTLKIDQDAIIGKAVEAAISLVKRDPIIANFHEILSRDGKGFYVRGTNAGLFEKFGKVVWAGHDYAT